PYPRMLPTCLLLFLALAPLSTLAQGELEPLGDPTWECGTDEDTKRVAEAEIVTHCPKQKKPVNNCCIAHDKCYDDQLGQAHCDNTFCDCLRNATKPSKVCAEQDGPFFCELVKLFGEDSYRRAGLNGTEPEHDAEGSGSDAFYDYEAELGTHKRPSRAAIIAVAERIHSSESSMPPLHTRVRRMLSASQHARFQWQF
ncbi:hypothetical protein PENTCL1PPCAC_24581, partial [Pristionchus entomophagus]